MPRLPLTLLACLALASAGTIAGCGSDDDSSSSNSSTPPPAAAPPPAATSASGGDQVTVSMKNIKFVPHDITAKVGQKIHWTNDDGFAHTVTATSGAKFDSGSVAGGATYDYTPTKAGKIEYVCTIHPGQDGTITVTK